jgi:hypothetical protein
MDGLIGFGVLAFVAWALYRAGKRTGSRKGFAVGRSHGRWRR